MYVPTKFYYYSFLISYFQFWCYLRPHGQHSLVLAEDARKYIDYTRLGQQGTSRSSHQIYLTFPADSKFSEEEVELYFRYILLFISCIDICWHSYITILDSVILFFFNLIMDLATTVHLYHI
jgi:hypothetical protein